MKKYYKSIFISDIHLGIEECNHEKLIAFLDSHKCDNLYLVGDTIDFLHFKKQHGWSNDCNLLIRKIINKIKKGTKIKICIGNHDAFLGLLIDYQLGTIEIAHEFIHESGGKKYLVIHGDIFDRTLKYHKLIRLVCLLYSYIQRFWFCRYLRKKIDKLVERNINQEKIKNYMNERSCEGIIFGHTHMPFIDGDMINCGDMVNSCSLVVEDEDGFHLIYL